MSGARGDAKNAPYPATSGAECKFLPIVPIGLGLDMDLIVQCFAVVVIGGFGSILGTFVASLIVGVVYSFSVLIWPGGALAIIFLILVAVLIIRPWGLFGTEMRY